MFAARALFVILAALTIGIPTGPAEAQEDRPDREIESVVQGSNQFACDLYAKLGRDTSGNICFSPYSISTGWAMAYAGARGDTARQIADVLHFDLPAERLPAAVGKLRKAVGAAEKAGVRLNIATRLWAQEAEGFREDFLRVTRVHYKAGLAQLDFKHRTDESRRIINLWVKNRTEGKFPEAIGPGELDDATRLVLTSAVYFNARWSMEFDPKETKPAPFHVSAAKKVEVPLMFQKEWFSYCKTDGVRILSLPYGRASGVSLVLLLPEQVDGLPALEKRLTADQLGEWTGAPTREVEVYLPKFRLSTRYELMPTLKEMGITDAFSFGQADLSGMNGRRDLYVARALHGAFLAINEERTEAAGFDVIANTLGGGDDEKPVFRADHPFLFLIRDEGTGAILFMGRVTNPKEKE